MKNRHHRTQSSGFSGEVSFSLRFYFQKSTTSSRSGKRIGRTWCSIELAQQVFSDECKRRCLSDSVSDKLGKFVDDLEGIEDEEDIKSLTLLDSLIPEE